MKTTDNACPKKSFWKMEYRQSSDEVHLYAYPVRAQGMSPRMTAKSSKAWARRQISMNGCRYFVHE